MSSSGLSRAVVTGSSGFVGGHLVRRLVDEGCEVAGLSHIPPREPLPAQAIEHLADVRDAAAVLRIFREVRPEVVFHLAAQSSTVVSMRDPVRDIETNVLGSVHVALAAAEAGARRLVFFSTGGALYGQPDRLPANETTPLAPESVYGASKIAAEHELGALCPYLGLELTVVRPGNIYGPRQDSAGESGVVAIFAERMLRGEPVTIFGDGSQERDYIFVEDVVEAAMRAVAAEPATCVIGTGEGTTTLRLSQILASLTGYEHPPVFAGERPGDIDAITLDASHARERWGWEPQVAIEDGLARTIEWFRVRQDVS